MVKESYDELDVKREEGAKFNMAMATLMRISDILREINKNSTHPFLKPEEKLKLNVESAKQLLINSSPLLKGEIVEKYLWIFDVQAPVKLIISDTSGGVSETQGQTYFYDPELEKKVFKFVVDIQMELQKEKYFMPAKDDPRFALAQDY